MTKHTNSSHVIRNKPDSQRRELKHPKMSLVCFFKRRWPTCVDKKEERMMMMKDDERKLYLASCEPEMQTVPRETRRVVWDARMSFNAVVILTDEETRQLTDASRETYTMQWVDTDKNALLRGENDCVCVPAEHKGRFIGCGDFETTEGLRADPLAGNVDSHNIFCSWYAQHSRLHSLIRFHERILPRIRNRSNLAVSCSERRSYNWSNFGFASTHLRYIGCKG